MRLTSVADAGLLPDLQEQDREAVLAALMKADPLRLADPGDECQSNWLGLSRRWLLRGQRASDLETPGV